MCNKAVLEDLSKGEREIREGRAYVPNYLCAMITLLERTAKILVAFGEVKRLKGLGTTQKISVSFPTGVDPLGKPVEEKKVISPWTQEGKVLQIALKGGFITAMVLPPVKESKTNRYFIDRGMITLQWPDFIKRTLSLSLGDWRTMFDLSAARCLHYLFQYADWRGWVIEDPQLCKSPSEKSLDKYYNCMAMKCHLTEVFEGTDQVKVREEVTRILNRFIMVLLQHKDEGKRKHNNKDKAERYAYIMVKAILASKSDRVFSLKRFDIFLQKDLG